jgi:hypothetical protein
MRIGGGCIPPADVGPATASCSGGHPQTAAVSAATIQPSGRHRQVAAVPQPHRTPHSVRRRRPVPTAAVSRWVYMDGRLPAAAVSPPLLRGCGRVRGGQRPSGQHPAHFQPHRGRCEVSGSADTYWGSGPGRRSRRTSTVRTLGQWTRAGGHGQPGGARRCGRPRLRQGHADTAAAATLDRSDTGRPDRGRSGSGGRSIRRSLRLVTTFSTLPSRPALRAAACGGRPRPAAPRHRGGGLTLPGGTQDIPWTCRPRGPSPLL